MATYKEMCEVIEAAGFLKNKNGSLMTADEIFNYSPSGDLMRIQEWYLYALQKKGRIADVIKKTAMWDDQKKCFIADQDIDCGDFILLSGTQAELSIAIISARRSEVVLTLEDSK